MPRTKAFDEEQVLQKAMSLFWKQGFHATSMQNLVDELGISRASLYDTYGDKRSLFLKAFDLYRSQTRSILKQKLQTKPQLIEGFRNLFYTEIEQSLKDRDAKGCFVVNTTTELLPGDEEITRCVCENKKVFTNIVVEYLEYGKKAGQLAEDKDTQALADLFYTFFNGLKVVIKLGGSETELKQMVEEVLKLVE